ncbi:uncharacterized protein LOC106884196 isoform X1 [Octopus bimaculoides]|uniref:uncharacterized protein LOC106884196 isoform X1 n=1 Tax=Octopus bimaculoides TaxID=37653 RepID=UPI00071D0ED1|nr:uncharacterized protein LOC106884196 isoform X1 [Octopus bimaculoides]|eukprot:XP_014790927.1 PREDICTED: uncharacterized protein LOC106884196 isoform X2 [Octopus bimaculoides]
MFESQDAIDLKQLKHSTGRIPEVKHLPLKLSKLAVHSKCLNCRMCVNILRKHAIRKPFRSDTIYFPKKQVRHISMYSPVHYSLKNDLVRKCSNKIYIPKRNGCTEYAARNMKTGNGYQFEVISKSFCQIFQEDKVSTPDIVFYSVGFTVLCTSGSVYVLHPKLNFSHKKLHFRRILTAKHLNYFRLKIWLKTKRNLMFKTFNSQGFPEKDTKFLVGNKDEICNQPDLECFQCLAQKYSKIIDSLPINIDELNLCHKYRNSVPIYELNNTKHCIACFAVFVNDIFEIILDFCQPTLEVIIILLINLEFHVPFLLKAQENVIEFWDGFYIEYLQSLVMKTIQLQKLNLKLGNSSWKMFFLMTDLIIITSLNVNELNYLLVIILPEAFGAFEDFPRPKVTAHIFVGNGICKMHQMLRYLKDNVSSFDVCTQYNGVGNLCDRFSEGNHSSSKVPKEHFKPLIPSNILASPALIMDIKARYLSFFRQLFCYKLTKLIDFIAVLAVSDGAEAKIYLLIANIFKAIKLRLSPVAIKHRKFCFRNSLHTKAYKSFSEIYLCKNLFDCSHIYLQIKLFEKAAVLMIIWKSSVVFPFDPFKHAFLTTNILLNTKASVENFYSTFVNYKHFQQGLFFYSKLYIKSGIREQSYFEEFTQSLEWGKYGIKHVFLNMRIKIMKFCKFNVNMLMIMATRYLLKSVHQSDIVSKHEMLPSDILHSLSYEKYLSFANHLRILSQSLFNLFTSLITIYTITDYDSSRDLYCSLPNCKYNTQCLCAISGVRFGIMGFRLIRFQLWLDFPFFNLHLERNEQLCADTQLNPSLCIGHDKISRLSMLSIICKYFSSVEQTKIKFLTFSLIKTYNISRVFTIDYHVTVFHCNGLHIRKQLKKCLHIGKTDPNYPTSSDKYKEFLKIFCNFSICDKTSKLRPFDPKPLHNYVANKETSQTMSIVKRNHFGDLWGNSVSLKELLFGIKNKTNFLKSDLFLNTSPAKLFYLKSSTMQFFKNFLNEIPILNVTYTLCIIPVESSSKPKENHFFDVPCHPTKSSKHKSLNEYPSESEKTAPSSLSDVQNKSSSPHSSSNYRQSHTQSVSCAPSNTCNNAPADFSLVPSLPFTASLTDEITIKESNHGFYLPEMDSMMPTSKTFVPIDMANIPVPTYGFMKDSHYYGGDMYFDNGQGFLYPQPPPPPPTPAAAAAAAAALKRPIIQRAIPYLDMNNISHHQAVNFPSPIANGYESFSSKFQRKPIPHLSDSSLKETSMRRKTKRYQRKFSAFPPDPEFEAAFRRTMVEQFATFTNYPFEFSKWCLEWSQWDYGKAAQTFIYNDFS